VAPLQNTGIKLILASHQEYIEKIPCSNLLKNWDKLGNVKHFLMGLKSVSPMARLVEVIRKRASLPILCKEHESEREKPFTKGPLPFYFPHISLT
jgi:hypothetical protein